MGSSSSAIDSRRATANTFRASYARRARCGTSSASALSRKRGEHVVETGERLSDRSGPFDRDTRHLEPKDRERHRDPVIAARVDDTLMKGTGLDADRVRERLRGPAERVDPVRDRDDAIALLLAGVADAGELRR